MDLAEPKYLQVKEHLKREILRGCLKEKEKLPTEPQLAAAYGVSRETLRRALELLVSEGLIKKRKRAGNLIIDNKAKTVAILYYTACDPSKKITGFYGQVFDCISKEITDRGDICVLLPNEKPRELGHPGPSLESITQVNADIHVTIGIMSDSYIGELAKLKIPAITVDYIGQHNVNSVTTNSFASGLMAAGHLADLGHQHIAYFGTMRGAEQHGTLRTEADALMVEAGFHHALSTRGLEYNPKWTANLPTDEALIRGYVMQLMKSPKRPSAFIIFNPTHLSITMSMVKELGFSIPNDVSFIGIHDKPLEEADLKVTSIVTSSAEMGESTVDILNQYLDRNTPKRPSHLKVNPILVPGATCAIINSQ